MKAIHLCDNASPGGEKDTEGSPVSVPTIRANPPPKECPVIMTDLFVCSMISNKCSVSGL